MASTVGAQYGTTKRVATNANMDIREFGQPKRVMCNNLTNGYRAEWNQAMADAEAIVTATAGDRSVVTSNGFTMLAGSSTQPPGFRLGALANVNDTTTENLLFELWY